jgi:RES domain-containing protein
MPPETYAGAMLEMLANTNIGRVPKYHAWIEIVIGEDVSVEVADRLASRTFGDQWHDEKRSTVLIVPSTLVRVERNVVINQNHPGLRKLRATKPKPVVWDERLFDR